MSSTLFRRPFPMSAAAQVEKAAISGLRFDWAMVILSAIFVGGLFLDGWAHNHGKVDESFFTPWHAFFYGGFLLTALALISVVVVNRRRGHGLFASIPDGYKTTLTGLMIFGAGGVGDMLWHAIFGIERGIEALFSPTHLMLGVGIAMVVSGPLRAAWNRRGIAASWRTLGPALLSTSLLMSTLSFFLMFAHPINTLIGGARHRHFLNDIGVMAGMMALLVMAALMIGPILLIMRRWRLPLGALTLIWGLHTAGMAVLDYERISQFWLAVGMFVVVVVLDLLVWRFRTALRMSDNLRIFAFAAPVLLFAAYFAVLDRTEGIGWSIHLWTGSVFLTGVTGLLLSYLLMPPTIPVEEIGDS
ncbi:MAG: hypothetical protein KF893_27200 [Caldilineaceae bacterium]|nr:hypothetical protein [Caldilineaceae bacterium]